MTHANPNAVPDDPIDAGLDFSKFNQAVGHNFFGLDFNTGRAVPSSTYTANFKAVQQEFLHENTHEGLQAIAFRTAGLSTKDRGLASFRDALNAGNVGFSDRTHLMETARQAVIKLTARPVLELIARTIIGQATKEKLTNFRLWRESLKQRTWGEVNYRIRNVDSLEGSVVLRRLTRSQRASNLAPRIGSWGVAKAALDYRPPESAERTDDGAKFETHWDRHGDATVAAFFMSQTGNGSPTFYEKSENLVANGDSESTVSALTVGRQAVVGILQNASLPNRAAAKELLKELNVPTR